MLMGLKNSPLLSLGKQHGHELSIRRLVVTPHAWHVHTHPSLHVLMSWHSFSHVCHLLHVTPASWHLPSASVVHLYMSTHSGIWHPHALAPTTPMWALDTSMSATCPSGLGMTCIMCPHDLTSAMHWDACHVCTPICTNWVLPAVCQILWIEIHYVVLTHPTSYCCLLRVVVIPIFNSMHPALWDQHSRNIIPHFKHLNSVK